MRKVVASEFLSLDGVMGDPGWTFGFESEVRDQFKFDELASADALLLGRVTYEGFAAAWPQMEEQTGEYGAWMNGYPKHVVSMTLDEPLEWNNSTLVKGDLAEEISGSEAAVRKGHSGLRQRRSRKHAHGARPHRRIPTDGLPDSRGERETSL